MRRGRGFTLVELVVTVAILAVLSLGALPLAELTVRRNREHELRSALREIRSAIDAYKKAADEGRIVKAADSSGYPPNLDVLAEGVTDAKDPGKRKVYFLRRLPRDPLAGADADPATTRAAATWGLRSYESPPEAPQAGKDVFDVYTRAEGVGLNGLPYREW
jgi:general secretion pathway protein G